MCPRIYHYLYTDLTLLDLKDHRGFTQLGAWDRTAKGHKPILLNYTILLNY